MSTIQILRCGLTDLPVEALVNPANETLTPGCQDSADIFEKAGRLHLRDACRALGHCDTGSVAVTSGFALDASYIIHAVGPIWRGGSRGEPRLLYLTYQRAIRAAVRLGCHSIGFPLLSAGPFGYPLEEAWHAAVQAVIDELLSMPDYEMTVLFAASDDLSAAIGLKAARGYLAARGRGGHVSLDTAGEIPSPDKIREAAVPPRVDPSVLEDGSLLLQMKERWLADSTDENFYGVLGCLRDSLVVVPVSESEEGKVRPDILQGSDGEYYFAVFSRKEQIPPEYASQVRCLRLPILRCLKLAHEAEGVAGLVLDAFTGPMLLPFEVADQLAKIPSNLKPEGSTFEMEAAGAEEGDMAKADRVRADKSYRERTKKPAGPIIFFFREKDSEPYAALSQWYQAPFTLEGIPYTCCEQYMMAKKALVFGDLITYHAILRAETPAEMKKLGRQVRPYVAEIWEGCREEVVRNANLAKFRQNEACREVLLETGDAYLAEANPRDRIWGIGLSAQDAAARDPSAWRGRNLLGKILMEVRDVLSEEAGG